jgi:agmatine deiminase
MKRLFIIIIFVFFSVTGVCQNESEVFSFPAEFEKQEAIWMAWKSISGRGINKSEALLNIIKALTPYVRVNLFIDHDSLRADLYKQFEKLEIDKTKVELFECPNLHWNVNVRDPGPVFLKSNKGNLMVADMKWNFYGWGPESNSREAKSLDTIDHYVARRLKLPLISSTLVSEGGNREFNGKGTMMAVEYTEMNRNKGWSRDSIEKELLRIFGQKKIIWLKQGPAEDDPNKGYDLPSGKVFTIGVNHIDEFARFASANTILLAEVTREESLKDPVHKLSYERLEANYNLLKMATDQDGKPFNIIRVPVPEMIINTRPINSKDTIAIKIYNLPAEGGVIPYFIATSYLNFLVTNGVVLMASYWKGGLPELIKQKDEKAKAIIQRAFPDRKVIGLNVQSLNQFGGGIHCATQQQPSINW